MFTTVKFISFERSATAGPLSPAPNVRETDEIYDALASDKTPLLEIDPGVLVNKTLKVLIHHRGILFYLQGGLRIHRCEPTPGVTERVRIGDWIATVTFT